MRIPTISLPRPILAATAAALVGAGCGGGTGGTTTASGPSDAPPPPPMVGQDVPPPPPPVAGNAEEPARLSPIIGQTTDDIRDFDAEMQGNQNVQVSDRKITAQNPIALPGNAYVSIIGQAAILQIQHAVNLYHATNDRYPADTEEFMREIIQANGIRLPQLPGYQEYGYKADTHELVVFEYPDRKEELRRQVRGEAP